MSSTGRTHVNGKLGNSPAWSGPRPGRNRGQHRWRHPVLYEDLEEFEGVERPPRPRRAPGWAPYTPPGSRRPGRGHEDMVPEAPGSDRPGKVSG